MHDPSHVVNVPRSGFRNGTNGRIAAPATTSSLRRNHSSSNSSNSDCNTSCRPALHRSPARLRVICILFVLSWAWVAIVSLQKERLWGEDQDASQSQQQRRRQQQQQQQQQQQTFQLEPALQIDGGTVPCRPNDQENLPDRNRRFRRRHQAPRHTLEDPPPGAGSILHGIFTPFSVGRRLSSPGPLLSPPGNQTADDHRMRRQRTFDRARFRLFRTFCAAGMRHQTSKNAFWVVLVDERIEPGLMVDLTSLLSELPWGDGYNGGGAAAAEGGRVDGRAAASAPYLVTVSARASDAIGTMGSSFGWHDLVREYGRGDVHVATGDEGRLVRVLERIKAHSLGQPAGLRGGKALVLLETMLDVPFGLHRRGIEWIQDVVLEHDASVRENQLGSRWLPDADSTAARTRWWYLCGTGHLEWHNPDILFRRKSLYEEQGVPIGTMGLRAEPRVCASGVFTRVGILAGPSSSTVADPITISDLSSSARLDTYRVLENLPPCRTAGGSSNQHNPTLGTSTLLSGCLIRGFSEAPLVIYARGGIALDHVRLASPNDVLSMAAINATLVGPLSIIATEHDWEMLEYDFNVDRYSLWETSVYLYDHVEDVLLGHPCAGAGAVAAATGKVASSTGAAGDAPCSGWDDEAVTKLVAQVAKRDFVQLRPSRPRNVTQGKKGTVAGASRIVSHNVGVNVTAERRGRGALFMPKLSAN